MTTQYPQYPHLDDEVVPFGPGSVQDESTDVALALHRLDGPGDSVASIELVGFDRREVDGVSSALLELTRGDVEKLLGRLAAVVLTPDDLLLLEHALRCYGTRRYAAEALIDAIGSAGDDATRSDLESLVQVDDVAESEEEKLLGWADAVDSIRQEVR